MSDYLVQQIRLTPNIEVRLGAEVVGGDGGERLETLQVRDRGSNAAETIPARILFVLIGALPHTDWLQGVVQRDPKGFIPTGHRVDPALWPLQRPPLSFETSVPGIFAVGDVRLRLDETRGRRRGRRRGRDPECSPVPGGDQGAGRSGTRAAGQPGGAGPGFCEIRFRVASEST